MNKSTYNQLQERLSFASEDIMYLQGSLKNIDPNSAITVNTTREIVEALETVIQVSIELLHHSQTQQ